MNISTHSDTLTLALRTVLIGLTASFALACGGEELEEGYVDGVETDSVSSGLGNTLENATKICYGVQPNSPGWQAYNPCGQGAGEVCVGYNTISGAYRFVLCEY